jgi:CubicO group peptidase (beta-lactamase class C family)
MRSGLDFNEGAYDLKDDAIRIGLRRNLVKRLLKVKIKEHPGNFNYQSINTMLLGLIIERASGQKLQDYFQEKMWKAINTEHDATWNIDSKKRKHLLTSAGLNAIPVDFAKLGRLYLQKGILSGKTIINAEWINTVTNADTMEKYEGYKYQWWNKKGKKYLRDTAVAFEEKNESKKLKKDYGVDHSYFLDISSDAFNAFGFMEQVLYIDPQKNLIIVRIGRGWPDKRTFTHSIYELGEKF